MMKFKSLKCFNIFHMGKCFFCMQFITSMRLLLFIFVVLLSSCSMNSDNEITYDAPKIVFENATIIRYENTKKKLFVTAKLLESYPTREMFAGDTLYIVQFSNAPEQDAEIKASAGTALLEITAKRYFLGGNVFVQTKSDNMTVASQNLFFDGNENMLYGAKGESVRVQLGDNTIITGTDFTANTLSQKFQFAQSVYGSSEFQSDVNGDAFENLDSNNGN